MNASGQLQIDPGAFGTDGEGREVELVVPYTEWSVAEAVLKRAAELTAGFNASLLLLAVHAVPYPATFGGFASIHAHLVEQLVDLAGQCPLPASAQVIMARSREEGFRHALAPGATVLIGTRRHWWRTEEEKLARCLAHDGHNVLLVHVD